MGGGKAKKRGVNAGDNGVLGNAGYADKSILLVHQVGNDGGHSAFWLEMLSWGIN